MFPAAFYKKVTSCLYQLKCLAAIERGAMPVARSTSSQRSLESPFSHMQMYGTQHPALSKMEDSSKTNNKSKQKSKGTIRSASSIGSMSSSKSTKSGSSSKQAKRKHSTMTSNSVFGTVFRTSGSRNETSLSSTSFNVTQVGSSSPSPVRPKPQSYRVGVKSSSSSDGKRKNGLLKNNSFHACDITSKSSISKIHSKPGQSSSSTSKIVSRSSSANSTIKTSLLSHSTSTKSTSEVLLRFKSQASKPLTHSVNVHLNRQSIFPRHVKVPRREFDTDTKAGSSRMGTPTGRPLLIEEVGSGLERMQYQRVIVMSGAGISTASGIPDFRTPGTGLYDNLQQYKIPDPTAIFDITFFSHNPNPFFTLARELYPGRYTPNPVHYFVRLLQEKGVLLRNYTQNIDGLERLAGVKPGKLVEAHGSFSTASCIKCKTKQDSAEVKAIIFSGRTPRCTHKYCLGLVKPDIVFFGEDLPARFHSLQLPDFSKCDLLIVMGTSLEVEPFASLAALPRFNVPRVLINRELVGPFKHHRKRRTDLAVTGDLVESVWKLATMAGWREDLERLVHGQDEQCPGRTLSSISEREESQAAGTAERDLCLALSDMTLSERDRRKSDSSSTHSESSSSTESNDNSSSNGEGSSRTSDCSDSKSEWSVSDVFSGLNDK